MAIISKQLFHNMDFSGLYRYCLFFLMVFIPINTFAQNVMKEEVAGKEEIDIYMELLKTSGEFLFMPSHRDVEILIQNYSEELYSLQKKLEGFYKILNKLGYIDKNNIMEIELRTYKEHFFERKEMEIYTEYVRVEWKKNVPNLIIFRSRSSIMPNLDTKNTIFVLPKVEIISKNNDNHNTRNIRYGEPTIHVLATIAHSAGLGEKYHFYLPPLTTKNSNFPISKDEFRIFNFVIKNVPPVRISDYRLKILTLQYVIYRMRYLELKIHKIIRNRLKKSISDFYRSIPYSRY